MGLRCRTTAWGLSSATESGDEGRGVMHPCRGGWSRPPTRRDPLCLAPGRHSTAKAPLHMARRTTKRSCVSSGVGGSNQTVVGTSPSVARLPCIMATCGFRHPGDCMLRKPPTPWARWCGQGGSSTAAGYVPWEPGRGPLEGSPKPHRWRGST